MKWLSNFVVFCLLIDSCHSADQELTGDKSCTVADCAGFTLTVINGSIFSVEASEVGACQNTKLIVESDGLLSAPGILCNEFDYSCAGAQLVVFNSDLTSNFIRCNPATHYVKNACTDMNLTLMDSSAAIICGKEDCNNLNVHLFGSSHFTVDGRSKEDACATVACNVYVHSEEAVYDVAAIANFNVIILVDGGYIECTGQKCMGNTIVFAENSQIGFDCIEENACANTSFIINDNCQLTSHMDCDSKDRACIYANISVFGSDLVTAEGHLDCGNSNYFEDSCKGMSLNLWDSRLGMTCRAYQCADFKVHMYGASYLKLRSGTTLSDNSPMKVWLHSSHAFFAPQDVTSGYIVYPYVIPTISANTTTSVLPATTTEEDKEDGDDSAKDNSSGKVLSVVILGLISLLFAVVVSGHFYKKLWFRRALRRVGLVREATRQLEGVASAGLMLFAVQLWDLYTDMNLALVLWQSSAAAAYQWAATVFTALPWCLSVAAASCMPSFLRRFAPTNSTAQRRFRRITKAFVGSVALCGGMHAAVRLFNSRAFGLPLFSLGLTHGELWRFESVKVYLTVVLENVPQLCLQMALLIGGHSDIGVPLYMSMVSSLVSVAVSVGAYVADGCSQFEELQFSVTVTVSHSRSSSKRHVDAVNDGIAAHRKCYVRMAAAMARMLEVESDTVNTGWITTQLSATDSTLSAYFGLLYAVDNAPDPNDLHRNLVKATESGRFENEFFALFQVQNRDPGLYTFNVLSVGLGQTLRSSTITGVERVDWTQMADRSPVMLPVADIVASSNRVLSVSSIDIVGEDDDFEL